jgi:hypothetical protein
VDVLDLLAALGVEVDELLASWGTSCLLEVGVQAGQDIVGLLSYTVGLVDRLGLIGGMVLLVEAGEGRQEAVGDTVLSIEVDGLLNSLITEDVTMCNILSGDTGTGFLLLGDLIAVPLGVLCEVASVVIAGTSGTGNLDLCSTELGVIEEEGSLRGSLLFEGYGSTLCLSGLCDLDVTDLTTGKELAGGTGTKLEMRI